MDKWQLAHRLHRPLGWEFLIDSAHRQMTPAEMSSEKERRRVPVRLELHALGYTTAEINEIKMYGEGALLRIDWLRRDVASVMQN